MKSSREISSILLPAYPPLLTHLAHFTSPIPESEAKKKKKEKNRAKHIFEHKSAPNKNPTLAHLAITPFKLKLKEPCKPTIHTEEEGKAHPSLSKIYSLYLSLCLQTRHTLFSPPSITHIHPSKFTTQYLAYFFFHPLLPPPPSPLPPHKKLPVTQNRERGPKRRRRKC